MAYRLTPMYGVGARGKSFAIGLRQPAHLTWDPRPGFARVRGLVRADFLTNQPAYLTDVSQPDARIQSATRSGQLVTVCLLRRKP